MNFNKVPAAWRMPFMNMLDFGWGMAFAYLSRKGPEEASPATGGPQEEEVQCI